MSLTKYKAKRNFSSTPEPEGKLNKTKAKLSFVVQRHKASHLHYDFRLEFDGVLKSWAVPKGPSLNPKDKRLAMMVEDHPYEYKDFKGVIPDGYGAGIVEIWDKGYFTDQENSDIKTGEKNLKAGLKAGNLKFTLHGKKLKGEFALVKLKPREEAKDNSWLLIKHNDEFATSKAYDSEKLTPATSPINKWLKGNKTGSTKSVKSTAPQKKKFYKATKAAGSGKVTNFIKPMLAKETDTAFDSDDWLFEIKWDGYRAVSEIKNGEVKLYSRNGNSFIDDYPLIVDALKKIKHNIVLDGEIVILNENGTSDFQKLQHYEENTQYPLCYYLFDILSIDGKKTTELPLIKRKNLLKTIIPKSTVLKYSDHIIRKGKDFFAAAQQQNLEGVMAKKINSEYHAGARTGEWLKIKHHKSDEVVVIGFTEPTGARPYFGALVLAVRNKAGLQYAGHTGTGFDDRVLKEIYGKLKKIITKNSPFKEKVKTNMPVTWVQPKYIAEIKFTQWTTDGKMRHPVFLRMREEKTIKDVVMTKNKIEKASAPISKKTAISAKASSNKTGEELLIGKTKVKITNRDKMYFPDDKITKGMVVDYYQQMANYVLPYLKDRPESLKRNPGGINDAGFFHKDAGDEAPSFVKSILLFSESANKNVDYVICNDKATLAYLNNLGCIEINPWNSTTKKLDHPDYLIIDIDPSEKNTFEQVIETALAFKVILDKAKAICFCKTSGATGLHIFLPMGKKYTYEQVKDFAALLCTMVNDMLPKFTSMERSLKKRGNNMIYLDHLQNRKGQTLTCAYSLRPKKGATVSTPLEWKEVKKGLHPSQFHIRNIFKRVQQKGDIFKGVLGKGNDIKKCLANLDV